MTGDVEIIGGNARAKLKALLERIERLNESKAEITADTGVVYAEAKAEGFDTKILRKVVRIRQQDRAKRIEEQALIDMYLDSLGEL